MNKYTAANPQSPDGYDLRGLCHEKRQQYELAVYDFRSARKLAPNDREINENLYRVTKAWYAILYNDIEGYKRDIAVNPKIPDNYLAVGKDYKNLGQWSAAEKWYDKYLTMAHGSPDEIIRYSEILAKTNHISKGWPVLKRYTEEYPNDQRLWSKFGYFSMWLGKYGTAVKAFENSLAIKPYFKEAMDGLGLARGKGYIYTINDTSHKYFNYGMRRSPPGYVYPIDRYYGILRRHPKDNDIRVKLIYALVKADRFEEAGQQLQLLRDTGYDSLKTAGLTASADSTAQLYYVKKIKEDSLKLAADSLNKKIILELGMYYSKLQNYDPAVELFSYYLKQCPGDKDVEYQLAEVEARNRDFFKAYYVMKNLLKKEPGNLKYQLFAAQLDSWIGQNFDEAENYFKNVLAKEPGNLAALVGMSSVYMQRNDFSSAEADMEKIKKINPYSAELKSLRDALVLSKFRYKQARDFEILREAEDLYARQKCEQALPKYEEFLKNSGGNPLIEKEYADANACAGHYRKAIDIYSKLLKQGYNFNIDYARATVYMSAGDSVEALNSFMRLAKENPRDFNANLYLGDSYFRMREYGKAKSVYDSIKAGIKLDSAQTAALNMRYSWLPVAYVSPFFSYAMLTPYGSYYSDNLGIKNNIQGLRVDLGITNFMTLGIEGFRSDLSADTARLNSKSVRLHLIFRFWNNLVLGANYGRTYYRAGISESIGGAFLRYESENKYSLYGTFTRSDASQILYSPFLIGLRINSDVYGLGGYYRTKSGVKFSADAGYLNLSDGNSGYNLALRLGYYFTPELIAGYELYNSGWNKTTHIYYSPSEFTSNNIFADWDMVSGSSLTFTVGGLIGIIENSSSILRQAYASAAWRVVGGLTVQGRISGGGSFQNVIGYRAFGASLAVYWNL